VTIHWDALKIASLVIGVLGVCLAQGVIPPEYVPIATAVMGLFGGLPANVKKG
jgi:hypothetical protein